VIRRSLRALLLLPALALPSIVGAQTSTGNLGVVAVIDVALVGAAVRDLDFAYVTPGSNQTVAPSDASGCAGCFSGKWTFAGLLTGNNPARRNASLTFTQLPAVLTSASGATLPLSWTNSARSCLFKSGLEYFCFPAYTPVEGAAHLDQINGAGAPGSASEPGGGGRRDLNVYLGGIAAPTAGQRAGYYTGTITLTFTYSN
jgi:hypothetical protein